MVAGSASSGGSSSSRPPRPHRAFKVVFLGQQGVGKTSVIRQFMYRTFDQAYSATVGIDFVSKLMQPSAKEPAVKLQLWDTAGQERFRALIPGYLRDAAATIVVYDITSRESFNAVRSWVDSALEARSPTEVVLVLVANKVDLEDKRQIQTEEGEALAAELQMLFFEVSAKRQADTAGGVDVVFEGVARALPTGGTSTSRGGKYESDDEIVLEPPEGGNPGGTSRSGRGPKKCDC